MTFDLYIGIDYSGRETPTSRTPALQVYAAFGNEEPRRIISPSSTKKTFRNWCRKEIAQWLIEQARKENLSEITGIKKQDLVFRILKERVKLNGLMFGEGTLEILPDGFGFLRSPDYHYLSCPDDIYVSPSQIRRFGLRTGATVSGQIRPPKENERYFALLRVEAINYQDPNELAEKVFFDDLTPLHPDSRVVLETTA